MLCPQDTFVLPSTTGLTTHGATFIIVLALYYLSFSGRFVMFPTVLRVRLEKRFEMTLTQRLFIYFFSKRNSTVVPLL